MTEAVPYGAWPSVITAARLVEGAAGVGELRVDGLDLWWSESRPSEGGRTQLVRRSPDGTRVDVLPDGWNARTAAHEYGGGAWCVRDGVVWFSHWADQRLHRFDPSFDREPTPVTPEPAEPRALRFADAVVVPTTAPVARTGEIRRHLQREAGSRARPADPVAATGDFRRHLQREATGGPSGSGPADRSGGGARLICVRESHDQGGEARNELVSLPADGAAVTDPTLIRTLVAGPDFVASPRVSPDGRSLTWIQWHHPDMPWDGTELCVARLDRLDRHHPRGGDVTDVEVVAGGRTESVLQPEWDGDGGLWFLSDRSGWWNLHRMAPDGAVEHVAPMEAEIGGPQWVFGLRWYALLGDGRVAVTVTRAGRTGVAVLEPGPDGWQTVDVASRLTVAGQIAAAGDGVVLVGATPTTELAPLHLRLDETAAEPTPLRPGRDLGIDPATFSVPEPISFASSGGRTAHALLYRPANPAVTGPVGERPPLLVFSHGGPTSSARAMLDLTRQFWTSRGFAVVDVDYGGSTGYGTAYRRQLDGAWGIVDVDDCLAAARHLADQGDVDPGRLAIRGGSAGGYTTLCALTFDPTETFAVGASHYGVADLAALARDTHKFESRYLDRMVGPWPEARQTYVDRSPIHHTDRLERPLIVFQGLDDEVVPSNQAEMLVDALDAKGVAHAYVAFAGEQHGFRQAPNIIRALEAELWFYGQILGFTPADPIEPVAARHLT